MHGRGALGHERRLFPETSLLVLLVKIQMKPQGNERASNKIFVRIDTVKLAWVWNSLHAAAASGNRHFAGGRLGK